MIWSVETGRININLEIALLSRYIAQPRHGSLDQLFHTFSFIKPHAKRKLVLYTFKNDFDVEFTAYDWDEFYCDIQEDFTENAPEERLDLVTMT